MRWVFWKRRRLRGAHPIPAPVIREEVQQEERPIPIATIAVDLAKTVFEFAAADGNGKIVERRRLSRAQFERYFENRECAHIVMEACGTAHYWGRRFEAQGMRVSLLPPHYVRAYVRRNKTDSAVATALLEAVRASDIVPVPVKSVEQQAIQGLHRLRSCWRSTCTARINTLRGLCREWNLDLDEDRERPDLFAFNRPQPPKLVHRVISPVSRRRHDSTCEPRYADYLL